MRILLDTNILGRLSQPTHATHSIASSAVARLRQDGHEIRLVPQVIYEYWVVATRPTKENGLGFTIEQAQAQLAQAKQFFSPLRDERGILEPWEKLIVDHLVQGKPAHDARLVAAMERHGLMHILTFNAVNFQRYQSIGILDPAQVVNPRQ
jgi:predicted nucleic acid-binding protein